MKHIRKFKSNLLFEVEKLLNRPGVTVKAMFVTPHGDEDIIYVVYEEDKY